MSICYKQRGEGAEKQQKQVKCKIMLSSYLHPWAGLGVPGETSHWPNTHPDLTISFHIFLSSPHSLIPLTFSLVAYQSTLLLISS
jgi:hypothetical protein